MLQRRLSLLVPVLLAALLTTGCSYLKARGNDAKDMFDVGVTIGDRAVPSFGLYFDFFQMLPLGYANVEGKVLGVVNSQVGYMPYENRDWGALAWGFEKEGAGKFNPADPYQARNDQRDLTKRPGHDVGFVRTFITDNPPPWPTYIMCNRFLHLGYIGILFNIRPLEILDFAVGWTTLDVRGDDGRAREKD